MKVCKECFLDDEIRAEIETNSTQDGLCEICGARSNIFELSEFDGFFTELLSLFSPEENSHLTIAELLQTEFGLFSNTDIANSILEEFLKRQDFGYTIDSLVDYKPTIKARMSIWGKIKQDVRENSRFFTDIDDFHKYDYLSHESNWVTLKEGTKLFRSRIHHRKEDKFGKDDMGAPSKQKATSGRANPVGIPYLYLSDSPETTYFEVRAVYLDKLSVATFQTNRPIKLIDFTSDTNIYFAFNDFEEPFEEIIIRRKIKRAISDDLSKPLRRFDSEVEYVPTQYICEYCRHKLNAEGIMFESSLHRGGINYVLFEPDTADCVDIQHHEITNIEINGNLLKDLPAKSEGR